MAIFSTLFIRRLGLLAGLLLGLAATAWAQAPAWQNVVLAAPATASSQGYITASATDVSGNVYIAGAFSGTINLGGGSLTTTAAYDVFVAKWSPITQSFVWVQRSGGIGHKTVTSLAVSGNSVYVAGNFYTAAVFGGTTLTSAGTDDAFVAKLTDAGTSATFTWAQRIGSAGRDRVYALATSGTSVYLAGSFVGTVAFGGTTLTSAGSNDAFITKLIDAGPSATFAWTQVTGSSGAAIVKSMAVQGTSIYLLGIFGGTAALGTTTITATTAADVFLAKLTDAGSSAAYIWVQHLNGTNQLDPSALAAQGTQVYLLSGFSGTVSFGSTTLTSTSALSGHTNAVVAKLADAGTTSSFVWAHAVTGNSEENSFALAVQGTSVYIGGSFYGTAVFDATVLNFGGFSANAFVAKLTDTGSNATFSWAKGLIGLSLSGIGGLAITSTAVYVGGGFNDIATFDGQPFGSAGIQNIGFFATLPTATGLAATGTALTSAKTTVFPTPTPYGMLATVQLPTAVAAGAVGLTVLDNLGRVVRTYTAPLAPGTTQTTLDVAGLTPGVYALRVAAGETLSTARLVVE